MSDRIRGIQIFQREEGEEYTSLSAGIDEKGGLVVAGEGAGPSVKDSHGDWDYEYWLTVPGEYKDTILLYLLRERFESFSEIEAWLTNKRVEYRRGFM